MSHEYTGDVLGMVSEACKKSHIHRITYLDMEGLVQLEVQGGGLMRSV